MGEVTSKYYQRCDFCHKEIEVSERGMDKIRLPGYVYDEGAKTKGSILADICLSCIERLRKDLESFVQLEEISYAGDDIKWKK